MFQDPKYAIFAVSRQTGQVVPQHMPMMLFVAKDALAADHAIKPYTAACFEHGADNEQVQSARERLQAFRDFAADHPGEMKLPSAVVGGPASAPVEGPSFPIAIDGHHTYWLSGGNVVQFVKPAGDGTLLAGTTTEEVLQMLLHRLESQLAQEPSPESNAVLGALRAAHTFQTERMQRKAAEARVATGTVTRAGIDMVPCTSSNVLEYGYRKTDQTLAVLFKGGKLYHYSNVPPLVAQEIAQAQSVGSYIARHVANVFDSVRVEMNSAATTAPA